MEIRDAEQKRYRAPVWVPRLNLRFRCSGKPAFWRKSCFWILLLLCATALVIFARLRFADFVNFFISRQVRYGANVALSIVGVIGIAVFVNAIVAQRFDKRTDLTRDRLYSLSEPTEKILKSLNIEIQITTFISERVSPADRQRTIEMLNCISVKPTS